MIAGLRDCGEDLSDFVDVDVSPGEPDRSVLDETVMRHLGRLGWRKRTEREWHASHVVESSKRLATRVNTLRKVKEFEARPASEPGTWLASIEIWTSRLTIVGTARWEELGALSAEDAEAASETLGRRIFELAATGRVNEEEYRRLMGGLGWRILGFLPPFD